jgi:hypothetical protein
MPTVWVCRAGRFCPGQGAVLWYPRGMSRPWLALVRGCRGRPGGCRARRIVLGCAVGGQSGEGLFFECYVGVQVDACGGRGFMSSRAGRASGASLGTLGCLRHVPAARPSPGSRRAHVYQMLSPRRSITSPSAVLTCVCHIRAEQPRTVPCP